LIYDEKRHGNRENKTQIPAGNIKYMAEIELIARALIQRDDEILLTHKIGEPNTFLPGGHVDYGEYTDTALWRELREELGIEALIGDFMGTLEYQFREENGPEHHEINFIYQAETAEPIQSKESHLEFQWCPLDELIEKTLLPEALPELIKEYFETGRVFHRIG